MSEQTATRTSLAVLRGWLQRYETATAYLSTNLTTVEARKQAINDRDRYGALLMAGGMRDALDQADALREALIRSQAVLTAMYESAVARDLEDAAEALRDLIHANDLALRER